MKCPICGQPALRTIPPTEVIARRYVHEQEPTSWGAVRITRWCGLGWGRQEKERSDG
jgi:hypothetical protein